MIRPENDELEMVISIALKTAPTYALRNVMTASGKLDRGIAIDTLTARVVAALGLAIKRCQLPPNLGLSCLHRPSPAADCLLSAILFQKLPVSLRPSLRHSRQEVRFSKAAIQSATA